MLYKTWHLLKSNQIDIHARFLSMKNDVNMVRLFSPLIVSLVVSQAKQGEKKNSPPV